MTELQIDDQLIQYDREATAAIYSTLKSGGAEECGCIACRNFAAQRDSHAIAIDFTTRVKWILPETPEYGREAAILPQIQRKASGNSLAPVWPIPIWKELLPS